MQATDGTPEADESLAERSVAGDPEAFRALVERYAPLLFRFAFRFTRDRADAEDLVQETFLRVHKHLSRVDLSQPLRPWLYTVCGNLCRNFVEKKRSIPFSELEGEDDGESFADRVADADSDPRGDVDEGIRAELVRAAVAELPEKYRVVVELHYFDDLSYEEIASALDIPLNTVRTHLRRAKERLESALRDFLA